MVQSNKTTIDAYLASLSPSQRDAITEVRSAILTNLPPGFEEVMQYGMISYIIPFSRYPITYNKQPLAVVSLAAQKNYCSIYLLSVYANPETAKWFQAAYHDSGKKLDMGKSCIRFKQTSDLALDIIGQAIGKTSVEEFIELYEESRKQLKK
ncbi:DUF1801 domain-containing protein [Candidatus Gracilibacteria bacterium]|nr:DUF1801 domain-containing protein [Candidatus Gracilibacteria bacterium]